MRVILLRHGETAWNRDGVFRGTEDVPLNSLGQEQAALTGERLKRISLTQAYTSPLSRSRDTALGAVKPRGLLVENREFLNDMHFGQWQGHTVENVAAQWPKEYDIWLNNPSHCQTPGGESLAGVMERVSRGLEDLIQEKGDGDILLVSHRVIIKLLLLWAVGTDSSGFWKIRIDNCSLSSFIVKKGFCVIERINDTCHLKGLSPSGSPDF
jgi:broad specificity phosphatase PhoE